MCATGCRLSLTPLYCGSGAGNKRQLFEKAASTQKDDEVGRQRKAELEGVHSGAGDKKKLIEEQMKGAKKETDEERQRKQELESMG